MPTPTPEAGKPLEERTCDRCAFSTLLDDRKPHDLTDWTCSADGWEGYVNPDHPPCGGLRFSRHAAAWTCKAHASKLPEPADCDWPMCGCDPVANKVTEALEHVLTDAAAVHVNMLRGSIAKPTPAQIGHLYSGDEAREVIAELQRQNSLEPSAVQGDVGERCMACDVAFKEGDHVLDDVSGGTLHVDCCGPERESYVRDIDSGEPLTDADEITPGYTWSAALSKEGP